ncbi:hypothetical protein ACHWQZ_G017217 [Mnemiopsis leidyi]
MIFVVVTLALPLLSLQHVLSSKESEEIDILSKPLVEVGQIQQGMNMLVKVLDQVRDYECARDAGDCIAWKAFRIGDTLTIATDCDKTPEAAICQEARDFLEMSGTGSQHSIISGLADLAGGIDGEDFRYVNKLMDAVVDYVCYKEKDQCALMRKESDMIKRVETIVTDN